MPQIRFIWGVNVTPEETIHAENVEIHPTKDDNLICGLRVQTLEDYGYAAAVPLTIQGTMNVPKEIVDRFCEILEDYDKNDYGPRLFAVIVD